MTHRMGRAALFVSGCSLLLGTLQSIPRGVGPVRLLRPRIAERRFERLGYMRCRAHLILSTRLENVFTAAWLIRDY